MAKRKSSLSLEQRIGQLSENLAPLKQAAVRYAKYQSSVSSDGVLQIANRPWVAPQNFMLRLYPGTESKSLDRYSKQFGINIPAAFREFLLEMNGAFCFGMSLFGLPLTMLKKPPLLDRSVLRCHDLATANRTWLTGYRIPPGSFHFGSRNFSENENVGYFIAGPQFYSYRKSGELIGQWTSFRDFLRDELKASAALEEILRPSQW